MSQQGSLSIERMCQLAPVSRAGFYRSLRVSQPLAVRATIQQIALTHRRRYGYRRITAELRRQGLVVNHKRVARLMREDNLPAVRPRAFRAATEAQHDLEVYLNLARRLTLTFIDQYYNRIRLHSALGYRPPEEFERTVAAERAPRAATMQFFTPTGHVSSQRGNEGTERETTETPVC